MKSTWLGLLRAAPNPILFLLFGAGVCVEVTLLCYFLDPELGPPSLPVVIFTVLIIWLSFVWILYGILRLVARLRGTSRTVALGAAALLVLFGTGYYALSWLFFMQSGTFLNWEVVRMTIVGRRFIAFIVTQCSPVSLVTGALVLLVAAVLMPFILRRTAASRWPDVYPLAGKKTGLAALLILVGAWYLQLTVIQLNRNYRSQILWLTTQANPVVAMGSSFIGLATPVVVFPTLDTNSLQPIVTQPPAPVTPTRSILYLAAESMRADVLFQVHQGQEVTPNLNALARKSLVFCNAYTQSTHTDYAIPSLLSSSYPLRSDLHYYYKPTDRFPRMLIYDWLKPFGYGRNRHFSPTRPSFRC